MTIQLDRVPLKRALISVYDKTGLEELASGLHQAGMQIVSTGSTAQRISAAGVPVTEVSEVTGFQECLDGRVKTLHPLVHAGILADRRREDHVAQLEQMHVEPFDLVVVNLYPFVDTVRSGAGQDAVVEQIDIGGPSMVRAAAKNHPSVAVVVDPARYGDVVSAAQSGGFDLKARRRLAALAFAHTAAYDNAVASWTAAQFEGEDEEELASQQTGQELPDGGAHQVSLFPPYAGVTLQRAETLRYGENPHQKAALYVEDGAAPGIAQAELLHGKPMSYNNYADADAALRAAFDFDQPAVAVVKHANPCGVAVAEENAHGVEDPIAEAHRKAHACDPVSAFGGVIAANREVTAGMARAVKDIFTEVVVAPKFSAEAIEILSAKKNLRLLQLPEGYARDTVEYKQVSGGMLLQARDAIDAAGDDPAAWTLAAGAAADDQTLADLAFAWRAVRAAKSNAVLLASDGATVGVGMGQVNRLDSCRLAVERANTLGAAQTGAQEITSAGGAENVTASGAPERARGAVAASDAFFPFADGLQILIDAGVKAVVQPGGSIRDEEVIAAAEAAGVTMYFTGARHFFHG
ncbi:bifunctional phosphoribosylaminoimidazolecarboxamide formyltransferase/IMP cyclohydrolase [Micrococcus terreus]|uniref:bifunctional phosphoribosylaminoimidazolecarboxamide formyltransferase/IMP cyclohydrolase n=1 Tax=Micrococcus terreus TaxID=574650 RepID=UPI0021A77AF0|nr:bifunctional phosphoribosylaminoimidazolecarboxamide formyltransferase/IMP cyclohydrolase [Micrococcus terreus]MCT2089226.1 bifunctional phosphoribosylaminoimidazolecarboxamide formyltransferase/IMP cyclohydrolase [Micrococcus terreus]MDK7700526.1 bifunctional phosphoribosylaminoimidazolecarboxamide formyltransferase/IMP cyclohydrolase [Micrococcus terreus]WOO97594.1 bifunctional phosphoribosylaminoimidazolecarboxamide formyltransferase/IMP cyclohydrolase [Micrococcus terreus]